MALYADRVAAGRDLAASLSAFRGSDAVVLGIPRGGVVVAAEVAHALRLPLGAVIVRKLGARGHEEFAIGAIAEGVRIVTPSAVEWARMSPREVAGVERAERAELERRQRRFAVEQAEITGRIAIVVDDGVATGSTALAACRSLRARDPARIVLAVPVAPALWRPDADAADEYVCPHPVEDFWAVGQCYDDFRQTADEEVARLLRGDLLEDDGSGSER